MRNKPRARSQKKKTSANLKKKTLSAPEKLNCKLGLRLPKIISVPLGAILLIIIVLNDWWLIFLNSSPENVKLNGWAISNYRVPIIILSRTQKIRIKMRPVDHLATSNLVSLVYVYIADLHSPGHSIIWLAPSSIILVVRYSVQQLVQYRWPHSSPRIIWPTVTHVNYTGNRSNQIHVQAIFQTKCR